MQIAANQGPGYYLDEVRFKVEAYRYESDQRSN